MAQNKQARRLASLWAASSHSPRSAGCFPGHSPTAVQLAPPQASVCKGGPASEASARGRYMLMSRAAGPGVRPLPQRSPPPAPSPGHGCLTLTAHSLVRRDRPLALGSSCQAHEVPCPPGPHHVAGLDSRPQQSPTPSAACQGARCCHWKKLLHNLKSWSFDHCSQRMKRRGSKWRAENASAACTRRCPSPSRQGLSS